MDIDHETALGDCMMNSQEAKFALTSKVDTFKVNEDCGSNWRTGSN
jgi:hypothetical protein